MTRATRRSRILWAGSGVIATVAMALAVTFAFTHTNGGSGPDDVTPGNAQPQSHVLLIDECGFQNDQGLDQGLIEPTRILLDCGDGEAAAVGLVWSQWGTTTANGHGTITEDNCVPDCADGTEVPYQVAVTLSNPVEDRYEKEDKEYFVRITLTFIGKHPGTSSTQMFKACEDIPTSPYMPTCPPSDQGAY